MDHSYIDQNAIADRYVRRTLPDAERASFEAHLVDCQECADRVLLAEMGCDVPDDVEIRVWDSSAEVRYLVLPQRPPGTGELTETELAGLVTRDSMIGVARL